MRRENYSYLSKRLFLRKQTLSCVFKGNNDTLTLSEKVPTFQKKVMLQRELFESMFSYFQSIENPPEENSIGLCTYLLETHTQKVKHFI